VSVRCSPVPPAGFRAAAATIRAHPPRRWGLASSTRTNQFGPRIHRFWVMTVNWAITTVSKRNTTNWTEWATVHQSPSPLPSKIIIHFAPMDNHAIFAYCLLCSTLPWAKKTFNFFFHGTVPAIQSSVVYGLPARVLVGCV
jgi:hypothetical protein